jgi:phosphoglycolate phosphatase-like HAD superfamily hydrolase
MPLPPPSATARIALFDIDGTLTATNAVDEACYFRAAAEVYGPAAARADWSAAPHVTDSAIAHWLAAAHRGRPPHADELDAHRTRFLAHLEAELARAPARFAPVPGAPGLLGALRAAGWHVALATGGWGASARLKLAAAGLADALADGGADDAAPLASADDGFSREDVVRTAAARAGAPLAAWERVVSVGDGVWDVRTAAALGLPFVGVGVGPRAAALRAAGAAVVLPDLRDRAAVEVALGTAPVLDAPVAERP